MFNNDRLEKKSVDDIPVPKIITNTLKRYGCKTVDDVINLQFGELYRMRGMGGKRIGILAEALDHIILCR